MHQSNMQVQFILYVMDQQRSRDFYSALLKKLPVLDVAGMTEFVLSDQVKLGLMPESGIAKIITPACADPATGSGIPRCELYLTVDNAPEWFAHALSCGALLVQDMQNRDWGACVGYVADPDGHIIAFAGPLV